MTADEITKMKTTPGLYTVKFTHSVFDDGSRLLVASIDGKLYGMVADNELRDDGWHQSASVERCVFEGGLARIQA